MFRIYIFVIASLLLHFFLYWGSGYVPLEATITPKTSRIEIELKNQESDSNEGKQIVRQVIVPENIKEATDLLKEKAMLLSEQTQRVKKQQQARRIGLSKNSSASKPSARLEMPPQTRQPSSPIDPDGLSRPKSIEELMSQSGIPRNNSPSTSGDRIDNVDYGNFTALNTDRHLFYSYYARIEEGIRWVWEREISQSNPQDRNLNSAKNIWRTRIDILLNADGSFDHAELLKGSGITDFDQAVTTAFRTAQIFPNPPKEMVGADGKIRLKYLFEVYYRPKILARP